MIIPPFAGVKLVEYKDRIELTPVYWYREIVGLGKCKGSEIGAEPGSFLDRVFGGLFGSRDVWVVVRWRRFEDGREEAININYLDPDSSEEEAVEAFNRMVRFANKSRRELEELTGLFKASDEDRAYIEERFPSGNIGRPDSASFEDVDVYQAQLKVLAGLAPKTVALIEHADATNDPAEREKIEREAVQAYYAEMAHAWTEELVLEWQRGNPVGTEWLCEFARVFREPEQSIDPINHELALNWLRRKYNLLTAEELSDAILVATGQRVSPGTLKKRRERLGLTTKRPPGPRPNSEA